MRWYILKTLLYKEAMRHAANRSGLVLAGLLVTAALVMAAFNPPGSQGSQLLGGIHRCFIDTDDYDSAWVIHLQNSVPDELKDRVRFRKIEPAIRPDQTIKYDPGTGAIQIRKAPPGSDRQPRYLVWVWHPEGDRVGMAAYENWFWRESYRFFHAEAAAQLVQKGVDAATKFPLPDLDSLGRERLLHEQLRRQAAELGGALPDLEWKVSSLTGTALDMRAAIATALVMFALFFTCVYLMPSLTCEERERGLLLAQVLSPARVREILAAKFLFYPAFGMVLASMLAGLHNPSVLVRPFFWLLLVSLALGSLGIGMTIASLTRTQRSASLGALCYMLVVALVLLVCQQNNISYIPYLAIEFHAPQALHATLTNQTEHWYNVFGCAVLAIAWAVAAGYLFRKRGWQ
jgi:hypothetical protein